MNPSPAPIAIAPHDTTGHWRDRFLNLGRTEADFLPLLYYHEMAPRVVDELLASFLSFNTELYGFLQNTERICSKRVADIPVMVS